jgi:Bifunctional DNA primase/polymerase, N-terminal
VSELEAFGYAQLCKWPIFPTRLVRCADGKLDKIPCIKDWPNAASTDPAQIKAWWRRWPDAVISIPTGERTGVIILDVDVWDDRNGFDTLADLGKSILPETPISHTPSGGVHIWFARTDVAIRNSAGTKGLGVGLDIRGDGGQVVVPSPQSGYW